MKPGRKLTDFDRLGSWAAVVALRFGGARTASLVLDWPQDPDDIVVLIRHIKIPGAVHSQAG